jgi:hypothetical protein
MICKTCKTGADIKVKNELSIIVKRDWHNQCKGGTHCACQHRLGRKNVNAV